jgi:hypothetical protein
MSLLQREVRTKLSSLRVCLVRLAVLIALVGLALAALASDGQAGFLYAFSQKVTSPPAGTGPADDFDLVVDTGTLAAGGASNDAPNIVGSVPGAKIQKGPFMSLIPQDIAGKPTQKLAHFTGGGNAAASTVYTFGFGLKQTKNVAVSFVSADWTANGTKLKPTVPTAGFAAPLAGKDQEFTLFDDTSVSFDVVNVSVLVNSPALDLSTLDPGNAPGFTSVSNLISLGVPFSVSGTVDPGKLGLHPGLHFRPSG